MATTAKVAKLPKCDLCIYVDGLTEAEAKDAEYDFKTQTGQWANGCKPHYESHRLYPHLGTGMGQRLVVAE